MKILPIKFRWHWKFTVGLFFLVGAPATSFALFYGIANGLALHPLSNEEWMFIKSLFGVTLATAVLLILEFVFEAIRRIRKTHNESDSIFLAISFLLQFAVGIPSFVLGLGVALLFYSSFGLPVGVFLVFISIGAFGLAAEVSKRQKQG